MSVLKITIFSEFTVGDIGQPDESTVGLFLSLSFF